MKIKTLDEILAEMGDAPVSASAKTQNKTALINKSTATDKLSSQSPKAARTTAAYQHKNDGTPSSAAPITPKKRKRNRKADAAAVSQVAHLLDTSAENSIIDEKLASTLKGVSIEPLAMPDRATRYMRWLAFYYLSNRELSQYQLRQKLLEKECDADAVSDLITEFAEKGYQSDERCAYMLIRESVRKGRGKQHIRRALKDARIAFDSLDELIAAADIDSISDGTILADSGSNGDGGGDADAVDWLTLAIEARCKKYGNSIPITPKDKAKQLRFLQYRGFDYSVCFDALKYSVDDLPIGE